MSKLPLLKKKQALFESYEAVSNKLLDAKILDMGALFKQRESLISSIDSLNVELRGYKAASEEEILIAKTIEGIGKNVILLDEKIQVRLKKENEDIYAALKVNNSQATMKNALRSYSGRFSKP